MNRYLAFILLALALLTACQSGGSDEAEITLEDVWARPALAGDMSGDLSDGHAKMGTGAVFMRIKNTGGASDRLTGAQSEVAQTVELHETVLQGDVASMQPVTNGIEIPAGAQATLKPGGYHVMLIGLNRDLNVGDQFALAITVRSK